MNGPLGISHFFWYTVGSIGKQSMEAGVSSDDCRVFGRSMPHPRQNAPNLEMLYHRALLKDNGTQVSCRTEAILRQKSLLCGVIPQKRG